MVRHLQHEIEKLKKKILALGAKVEENLNQAITAAMQRDENLARNLIEKDQEIDRMEVELEEECLKVLALHQPVAGDLRFIVAVLKINNDLERIGDLAVNIAERAASLALLPPIALPFDLTEMAREVRVMLKKSLDALVNLDLELADEVCASDDQVDAINRQAYRQVTAAIRESLEQLESLINLLSISRYLERIADHATNIAQDVIYLLEGDIVRHRGKLAKTARGVPNRAT